MAAPRSPLAFAVLIPFLLVASAPAQAPVAAKPVDPLALVTQAEALVKQKDVEAAVLRAWDALDLLATLPSNQVHQAAWLSARFLLQQHDVREPQRRTVFASAAKQQVELATAYRTKKWLDVAATRLAVADGFDADVGAKERVAIDAARPKGKVGAPAAAAAAPPAVEPVPLLRPGSTLKVFGTWTVVGNRLQCEPHAGANAAVHEWVSQQTHEDHELVVEFRPLDAAMDHNAGLWFGGIDSSGSSRGFCAQCIYSAKEKVYDVRVFEHRDADVPVLATIRAQRVAADADGFHRLAVQVRGADLRVALDDAQPLQIKAAQPVRGSVGLYVGVAMVPSCAMQFRNLRIDPLPADLPSDDELRAQRTAENQHEVTKLVGEADSLLAQKQPEVASLRLRDALRRVAEMPEGLLRTNLRTTIEATLLKADPLTPKRKKAAQTIAGELAGLADVYGKAGWSRAALAMMERASEFDPEGTAPRLAAAVTAVQQWNAAQAAARAVELAPPTDDGTVLRDFFAKGRQIEGAVKGFLVDGPAARASGVLPQQYHCWLPQHGVPKVAQATVHVHLPAGAEAGLVVDVANSYDFTLVSLARGKTAMRLRAFRHGTTKWTLLGEKAVPIDAWRLDGWHALTVASGPTGLVASVGTVKLELERKVLGEPNGVVGFYAGNNTGLPIDVEMRAFRVGP